jgi:hypothetical protein
LKSESGAARTEFFCNDYFDHRDSRCRLFFSDWGRVAAERQEWRSGGGFWRPGQPDGIRASRRGFGSFSRDDLVGGYFHDHIDSAVDFRGAAHRAYVCFFGRENYADEIATSDSVSDYAADGSAESGTDAEIRHAAISAGPLANSRSLASLGMTIFNSPHKKRILFPLFSYGCSLAVARDDNRLIRES